MPPLKKTTGRQAAYLIRTALVAGLSLAPAGCISLFPEPSAPPQEVTLDSYRDPNSPPGSRDPGHPKAPLSLKIEKVGAAASLQGQKILILTRAEKNVYSNGLANLLWNDPLPTLIQSRLIEGLQHRGTFKGVGPGEEAFRADRLYLPTLHHFEIQEEGQAFKAVIALSMREVDGPTRTLRREALFHQEVPVQATFKSFTAGLNQAFQQILREALIWIENN